MLRARPQVSRKPLGSANMKQRELENLGEPDLQIAGLRVWIHGRQFPDATDYWDGNWLRATAYCIYPESTVRVHGSIIHLGEIVGLLRSCERLYQTLEGRAALLSLQLTSRSQPLKSAPPNPALQLT